jgi:hypothetical protein
MRESKLPVKGGAANQNYRLARVKTTGFAWELRIKAPYLGAAANQNYL